MEIKLNKNNRAQLLGRWSTTYTRRKPQSHDDHSGRY